MTVLPTDPSALQASVADAAAVLADGGLVVLPTDTVYGIAADAFDADAVAALLAAKGRGRAMPPPVLVASVAMLDVLGVDISEAARALAQAFWPGALTLVVNAQPSLQWDLGETAGTVALRMPDEATAIALLESTGPLAVSSANRTGMPAATSVGEAKGQLGARVARYLDGGPSKGGQASTIVDATSATLTILREGAISREELAAIVPHLAGDVQDAAEATEDSDAPGTQAPDGAAG